ncbi:MAG: cbb3-type cytochrome oxidase assembly protein CcoS [bacterium]
MSVVVVLIGFSVLVALGFLIAFIWAVRSGQYDDKYTPSVRILFDDQKKTSNFDQHPTTTGEESPDHADGKDQIR